MIRRGLRLELVAALGMALALPASLMAAGSSQALTTQTTLAAQTHDKAGRTRAHLAVTVVGEDGAPVTGAVSIRDHGKPVAGAVLNGEGKAEVDLDLASGAHDLKAVYAGDSSHGRSVSQTAAVQAQASGVPNFAVTVNPGTISLTAGQSAPAVVTVTPENSSALTAPMFVTLSCSGLPDQATCTFPVQSIEILPPDPKADPNAPSDVPVKSTMSLQTQAASRSASLPASRPGTSPVALAFLLPGALALAGIAWGSRRKRWLSRISLVALVGLVAMLGTTACNPRYDYLHHGPDPNPGTPAGTFNVKVTAQSSNGVTTTTHSTTLALTVK